MRPFAIAELCEFSRVTRVFVQKCQNFRVKDARSENFMAIVLRNFSHVLDRIVGSFLTFLCNDTDIILLLCTLKYITGKLFLCSITFACYIIVGL